MSWLPRAAVALACLTTVAVLVLGAPLGGGAVAGGAAATDGAATGVGGPVGQVATPPPSGPLTTVAVGPNETVEGRAVAVGPRTVVAGTVEGDLRAYGGVVVLTEGATVTGDVQAFGGVVRLNGTVRGPVTAYGGRVVVGGETGDVNAGGGAVRLAGATGSATVLGGRVVLAPGARVGGDLEYDARLVDRGGRVAGARVPTDALLGPVGTLLRTAGLLPRLVPLLAGALAVGLRRLPGLASETDAVVERARTRPGRSLARGVAACLAAVAVLVLLTLSGVGTPLVGLALPACGAAALCSLAAGLAAGGETLAARLPESVDTLGAAPFAAALALLAALPTVGPPVAAGLALWGAGALAGGTTLKRLRAGGGVWT